MGYTLRVPDAAAAEAAAYVNPAIAAEPVPSFA
jgi:hypothetical protein